MTRKDDHHDNAPRHIKPKEPKDPKDGTAMYEPEYEQEQPSNEERELERLFADDLGVERLPAPPEGLADRIKAEIPADLGWETRGASADVPQETPSPGGVVVPFYRHRGFLALAATLVLAVGLWTIMPTTQEGTSEGPFKATAEGPVPETPTPDGEPTSVSSVNESIGARPDQQSVDATEEDTGGLVAGDLRTEDALTDPRDQLRERSENKLQKQLEELQRRTEQDSARQDADGRSRKAKDDVAESRGVRIPVPDPTPDEPEPTKAQPEPEAEPAADVLESEVQFGIPEAVPTPPPAASPAPAPARRMPPAMSAPTARENTQIEASSERIASLDEETRKLEQEMREMDEQAGAAAARLRTHTPQLPNDEAYDAMFFDSAGVNPFVDTEDDALSTFGFDVDTASYTVMRRYLQDGNLPPKEAVRVEEMLNFFDYGDAPPAGEQLEDGEFALHADVAPSPWAPGDNRSERYYLVRFGLKARDVLATERPPALLTFVVDVSGSMAREDRLGLVKRSLGLLLDNLQEGDQVALVVYGSQGRVLLPPTPDHVAVRGAIEQLAPEGSTNAAEGLRLAYQLTARNHRPGRIHRVILCSDGVANVGTTTSGEGILASVKRWADQGIELTTVGFGMGNYNDTLMETLADQGNGRYAYVDTLDEARRIFVDDLTGTLTTVAAEARAQVEFDEDVVSRYRLVGYENRDIADERFRDDTVDAGEIGAGHSVTALYEVKTKRPLRKRDRLGRLTIRYASIARGEMVEQARAVTGGDASRSFEDAPRALRLAATVAEFAEVLRGSYWAKDVDLGEVFAEAQRVAADWPTDEPGAADIAEFAFLVGKADRLLDRE